MCGHIALYRAPDRVIADAVEVRPPADLRTVAMASSDDELKELGLSATAIKKLRDTE